MRRQGISTENYSFMSPFNTPSWKTLVASVAPDAEFAEPATETRLSALEQTLRVHLPEVFRQLLLEFDGLIADFGAGVVNSGCPVR